MNSADPRTERRARGDGALHLKPEAPAMQAERPWKLLIVDDEPEVHSVTRLALGDFRFKGRELEFISAHSGEEAKQILQNDPEIAVTLLDVVMETDDAGLQVVQFIRQTLGNSFLRIILRTGHPGLAPERRIIQAYDINDYRAKTELTQDRMFSLMHTSLAAYERLTYLAHSRRYLRTLAEEYHSVLERITVRLDRPTQSLLDASDRIRQCAILRQDQRAEDALNDIDTQCKEIQRTTNALQRLGTLTAGEEAQQRFDANGALQEALERLDDLRRERAAEISVQDLPQIHGFHRLFVDLFEHLLRNAIQFQPGEAPTVEVWATARGKDWQFTVADRGPGVPADQTDTIFQTFGQLDGAGQGDAVGIGLAVCRKIVGLHGGKMWVTARQGGGSLFEFTIAADGMVAYGDG